METSCRLLKKNVLVVIPMLGICLSSSAQTGIGTTNPQGALHIVHSTEPQFIITNTVGQDSATFSVDGNGVLKITTVDGVGANGHILLNPDGNVGIGTSTPDKLIGIGDGTDEYSISLNNGVFSIWNDATPPKVVFQVDSTGKQIVSTDLDVDNGRIRYVKDSIKFIVNADLDVDNGRIKYYRDSVKLIINTHLNIDSSKIIYDAIQNKLIVNTDLDVDNGGVYYDKATRSIGIGTTSPLNTFHLKTTGTDNAVALVDAPMGARSVYRLKEDGTNRASFTYRGANDKTVIRAFDGTAIKDRIRMNDASPDILGDGVFTDNAFGPSEWVIGKAESGTVLCMINTKIDEDGKRRVEVEPCAHENCPNVIGVATPEETGVHHGNPTFEYMDKAGPGNAWEAKWRENHIGLELTGFRMTKVLGPVKAGDLLISSGIEGYAVATIEPGMGAILGKACEDLNEEKGMIWARIHLQSGSNLYTNVKELEEENEKLKMRLTELENVVAELVKEPDSKLKEASK